MPRSRFAHVTALSAAAITLTFSAIAHAADATAGKRYFRQQCLLCHSAEPGDNGGAQGPNLANVFDRAAASSPDFSYTPALKASGLRWDAATLEKFLASPTRAVPGSAMVIDVPARSDRDNLIAYFSALHAGNFKDESKAEPFPPPELLRMTAPPVTGPADWQKDAPGRVHDLRIADLAAPFATRSVVNFPRLVPRPADALPSVPSGFQVNVFAEGLNGPRRMRIAPNGDVILAETASGRIKVLRPSKDGTHAESVSVFAQGLAQPFGIALYPVRGEPHWLYVAEINRVVRYPYRTGDLQARAVPEIVVAQLVPASGGHFTRDLLFSRDGRRMFVSVGSHSNVAEDMPTRSIAETRRWERTHGIGASWGDEADRATVRVYEVGSSQPGRNFATGLRNCVGLALQPANGHLWCTVNERDLLGDDLVPDYSTHVRERGFYGWPWYYLGAHQDPRHKDQRPDLRNQVIIPDVLYQAHSAAMTMTFYDARSGAAAFPHEYLGDAFVAFHGSWNRAQRTGSKLVRIRMHDGVPTGEYQDFLTGFITDNEHVWGRPFATVVAPDGALLMSEDGNGMIYRIAYHGNDR